MARYFSITFITNLLGFIDFYPIDFLLSTLLISALYFSPACFGFNLLLILTNKIFFSSFVIYAFKSINFPVSTASEAFHKFFLYFSKCFLFSLTPSITSVHLIYRHVCPSPDHLASLLSSILMLICLLDVLTWITQIHLKFNTCCFCHFLCFLHFHFLLHLCFHLCSRSYNGLTYVVLNFSGCFFFFWSAPGELQIMKNHCFCSRKSIFPLYSYCVLCCAFYVLQFAF